MLLDLPEEMKLHYFDHHLITTPRQELDEDLSEK